MNRIELHNKLKTILGSDHVYFQPPESVKLVYPCIVYNLSTRLDTHADDRTYRRMKQYTVTFITKDPDSQTPDALDDMITYCNFERAYTADNLNHFVYRIYI